MLLSVVVASYLGEYKGAAKNREAKFIRAITSLTNQTFADFEVVIVADGCERTAQLYQEHFSQYTNIRCYIIDKQKLWSGEVRNVGIREARGEYITYLDTDDFLGREHLQIIAGNLQGRDWIFYNDWMMLDETRARPNGCELQYGRCGTSNITHRREMKSRWKDSTYAHDWRFISELIQESRNTAVVPASQYYICHMPGKIDV